MPKRRANGEGSIYPQTKDKNGKVTLWAATYFDNMGKRQTLYGKTQQIVREKLKEAIRKSDIGIVTDANRITFAKWVEEWLEVYARPTIRESTYASYYDYVYVHIIPAFPKILLKDLRTDMLQKFFNEKAVSGRADKVKDAETGALVIKDGGLSLAVLYRMKALIITILNVAIENNIILKNVALKIKLPQKQQRGVEIFSLEEQKKLEETILNDGSPVSFCVLLALYTGLRIGELAALKVEDIDFEANVMYVRRSLKRVAMKNGKEKSKIIINEPKTEKSKRIIPLPDFITDMLKKLVVERNEHIRIISECIHCNDEWVDEGFLFITQIGKPQEPNNIRKHFKNLLDKTGLKYIKFHALRHTFASRCIEAGFDIKSLSDILGHTDAKMTLNTYTHSLQEQKRNNMDKLAGIFNHK